jgi:hypothetical protein
VPTLGFQVVQVAIPEVTVLVSHPEIGAPSFIKLTVPVAAFELIVACKVFVAPYVLEANCIDRDVVVTVGAGAATARMGRTPIPYDLT